jgi:hypothetical protein
MSLLNHPEAQALLADAVVTPEDVRHRVDRLTAFLQRYLPRFYRVEQRATATLISLGRLGGLERKHSEPTAFGEAVREALRKGTVGGANLSNMHRCFFITFGLALQLSCQTWGS